MSFRAAAAALLVAGAGLIVPAAPAHAAAMTISSVTPLKVAAGTADQVLVVTGTNCSADLIGAVRVGAASACAWITDHIVTSASRLTFKTPAGGCAASPGGVAEAVTILAADGVTALATRLAAVTFVPPPAIAAVEDKPVYAENSSLLDLEDRITALDAAGNQVVRIKAGPDFAFDGRTPAALTGSLNGRPLTSVGFRGPDGTTVQGTNAAPAGPGNYWLARTTAPLGASVVPALVVTQHTVSRTFASTATGVTSVTTPYVGSLDVRSGKTGAATAVRLTGSAFGTLPAELAVTMCGLPAPFVGTPTANSITVRTPSPDNSPPTATADLVAALGGTSGICTIRVTRGTGPDAVSSAVTPVTYFAFVDR